MCSCPSQIPPSHFNPLLRKTTETHYTFWYAILVFSSRKVRKSFVQNNKSNVKVIQHPWKAGLCLNTQWFLSTLVPFPIFAISITQPPPEMCTRTVPVSPCPSGYLMLFHHWKSWDPVSYTEGCFLCSRSFFFFYISNLNNMQQIEWQIQFWRLKT